MNDEMKSALERLANDESLTDNLDDAAAKALLRWSEQQIMAGMDPKTVYMAARSANRDDLEDADAVIGVASATLGSQPVAVAAKNEAAEVTVQSVPTSAVQEPAASTQQSAVESSTESIANSAATVAATTLEAGAHAVQTAAAAPKPVKKRRPVCPPRRRGWRSSARS